MSKAISETELPESWKTVIDLISEGKTVESAIKSVNQTFGTKLTKATYYQRKRAKNTAFVGYLEAKTKERRGGDTNLVIKAEQIIECFLNRENYKDEPVDDRFAQTALAIYKALKGTDRGNKESEVGNYDKLLKDYADKKNIPKEKVLEATGDFFDKLGK